VRVQVYESRGDNQAATIEFACGGIGDIPNSCDEARPDSHICKESRIAGAVNHTTTAEDGVKIGCETLANPSHEEKCVAG